jgi:hypothetical protein
VLKYDLNGVLQWQRALSQPSGDTQTYVDMMVDTTKGTMRCFGWVDGIGEGNNDVLVVDLPIDGSGTGTYGAFTYEAYNLTEQAETVMTSLTYSLSNNTNSITVNTSNYFNLTTSGTLTETVYV